MAFWKKLFNKETYHPLAAELLDEYNLNRPMGAQPVLCHAPFKSMYFAQQGKVHTCCYNRTFELGRYPQQSIHDIWFGKEADKLREYIRHNDLSLGCLGCKQQIVAGNFSGVKTLQYDERTANTNHYPSVMEFELSNTCNLECVMCSGEFSSLIRTKREGLPALPDVYNDAFVEQLNAFIPFLDEVKFYGGEPFLVEMYYRIWERIRSLKRTVRISVQTNATVLNSRIKELLQQTQFHINISIDSLQPERYAYIRKNASLEKTLENIRWFREYCRSKNTFFGISVCAMKDNRDELPDFIRFCNEMECPVYFHTVVFPHAHSLRSLSNEELLQAIQHLQQQELPANTAIEKQNAQHYHNFIRQLEKWRAELETGFSKHVPESFEEMEQLLRAYMLQDNTTDPSKKAERIEKVVTRLRQVAAELGDDFYTANRHRLKMDDPFILDTFVFQLEKLPLNVLLAIARGAA